MSCGESCSRQTPCDNKGKSCCRNCFRFYTNPNKNVYKNVIVKNKNNEFFRFENCTMEDIDNNVPDAELIYLEKDIDIESTFKTNDELEPSNSMSFVKIKAEEWTEISKNQSLKELKVKDVNDKFFEFINKKFNFNEDILSEAANELIDNNQIAKADRYLNFIENKISNNLSDFIVNKDKNILNLYADIKYRRSIIMSTTPGNQRNALNKMQEARDVEKMVNAIVR